MNGLEQACRRLGIALPTITLRQAAALVAQIKYPRPMNVSHATSRQINTRTEHLIRLNEVFAMNTIVTSQRFLDSRAAT